MRAGKQNRSLNTLKCKVCYDVLNVLENVSYSMLEAWFFFSLSLKNLYIFFVNFYTLITELRNTSEHFIVFSDET